MISSPFWKNSARWLAAWASNFKIAAPDWLLLTALGNLFSFLVSQKERIFHREKSKKREKGLSILKSGETISHRGLGSKAHYDREQKEKKGNYIQFSRLTLLWPTELSVWIEKNKHTPLKRPKKNTEKKIAIWRMKIWKENMSLQRIETVEKKEVYVKALFEYDAALDSGLPSKGLR